jgi:hypothetical protein
MIKSLLVSALKLAAAAALVFSAPLAMARSDVNWSVSVGSPYVGAQVYAPPQVVYVEPQPVYVQPRPVYVRPRPVYVQPSAVVQYGQPYYVEPPRGYWRGHRHHHHGWRYND